MTAGTLPRLSPCPPLRAGAAATLLIPLSSLACAFGLGGAWQHAASWPVDATALAAVPVFLLLAHHARKRMRQGHADSVWAVRPAPAS